ncbi:RNA polymerase I-specific transcription initiation factor RRN3 [Thozetella sp. PMI_491]|nr:RNA polymerase I-specific transcription initiation factor RRN3 [Thozetella sp. PMI_491]
MTTVPTIAPHRRTTVVSKAGVPVKPILRKPTSILGTRTRDDQDDDDERIMSSPTKRRKTVVFNETLNEVKEIEGKSLDDAKREVRQALAAHAAGDSEDYDRLKEVFTARRREAGSESDEDEEDNEGKSPQELLLYMIALTAHVSLLGKSCSGLIRAVLKFSWLGRDDVFVRVYIQFIAALASAQGSSLALVLTSIIERFKESPSSWSVDGYPAIDKEAAQERLHTGLEYLLNLFPGATPITVRLLGENFPFADDSKRVHMDYINNLLRITGYAPKFERDVMELILSRVCELDVGMALDLEEDDDTTRAIMAHVERANLDGNDDDEGDDGSDADSVLSDETAEEDEETTHILAVSRKIQTLDAALVKLIEVYNRPFGAGSDSPEAVACFENLLSDFCNVILPNLKSRHIQFLVFHLAQKSRRFTEMFIGTLLTVTFDSNRPDVVKQAAAAYLASFVARGAYVPREFVQMTATTLLNYLDHLKKGHEKECRGPDLRRYAQYYSFMQGLLYIFCFRWADFIDEETSSRIDRDDFASYLGADLSWMAGLKERLQMHIYRNKLNPLKVLSPAIVQEFARICHHLNLMYIYPLLEQNKSIQLAQFSSYSTGGASRDTGIDLADEQWHHLEPYFPFDPYQLPASRRLLDLETTYMTWRSIPGLDKDEDEDESEVEADEDDEDDMEEDTATDDGN